MGSAIGVSSLGYGDLLFAPRALVFVIPFVLFDLWLIVTARLRAPDEQTRAECAGALTALNSTPDEHAHRQRDDKPASDRANLARRHARLGASRRRR